LRHKIDNEPRTKCKNVRRDANRNAIQKLLRLLRPTVMPPHSPCEITSIQFLGARLTNT
jgi:hypothetical protein